MEYMISVRLRASGPDRSGTIGDALARLRALRHRIRSFVARHYEFPGDIRAVARGAHDSLVAKRTVRIACDIDDMVVYRQSSYPVPHLDWSAAVDVATTPTMEVLITNKLLVRITGEAGNEEARAELTLGEDVQRHLSALSSMCSTAGFSAVPDAIADAIVDRTFLAAP